MIFRTAFILCVILLTCGCGSDEQKRPLPKPGGGEPPIEGQNPNLPSKLALPYIMSDNMVLQQNAVANIWGKAIPGSKIEVKVSWRNEPQTALTQLNGMWVVPVATTQASNTPHTITITDSQNGRKTISNVLLGEVWLCSGQSNMEMPMRGFGSVATGNYQPVKDADAQMATANLPTFRYFKVPYADLAASSGAVQFDTKPSSWAICTPTTAREYSAIAFFFGRKLNAELGVPIGIIGCSYGGTRIEAWMDPNALNNFSPNDYKDASQVGGATNKSAPHILYKGMISPVQKYTLRGFLWLQGESNLDNKSVYHLLLKEMVAGWRKGWGDAKNELPFYIVQIAPYGYSNKTDAAFMMSAQLAASRLVPNSDCVGASDVGDQKLQHYPNKRVPAERLAMLALHHQYARSDIKANAPVFQSMKVNGEVATITFSNATSLTCSSTNIPYMQVAGADKVFRDAVARIVVGKAEVEVSSTEVAEPLAVRYCFTSWHIGQLYNESGLPVFSFRTDTW